jgi:predicted dinucleotide-binding enzyme
MQIAIIGYGNMGSGIAKRAAAVGYSVVMAGRDLVAAKKAAASVGVPIPAKMITDSMSS